MTGREHTLYFYVCVLERVVSVTEKSRGATLTVEIVRTGGGLLKLQLLNVSEGDTSCGHR